LDVDGDLIVAIDVLCHRRPFVHGLCGEICSRLRSENSVLAMRDFSRILLFCVRYFADECVFGLFR
jgi:hypothetical protein